MRVAGFTFVRNAIRLDYPIVEAIQSVLPLCDVFIVAVGESNDGTRGLIESIGSDKLRIVDTVWDDSLRTGGQVLAQETDKAYQAIPEQVDWCVYIQGDECLHEQDHPTIRASMKTWLEDLNTEGLLLDYWHFYGSYGYVGISRKWYRREVRIVRHLPLIHAYRDAQGFRVGGRKLRVRRVNAQVYHYGWVRPPAEQQAKQVDFHRLWHPDDWVRSRIGDSSQPFKYDGREALIPFHGTHPAVMTQRIAGKRWHFEPSSIPRIGWKDKLSLLTERFLDWRPGEYRNYTLLS